MKMGDSFDKCFELFAYSIEKVWYEGATYIFALPWCLSWILAG